MYFKFFKNQATGIIHLFECNLAGLRKSRNSVCGIDHNGIKTEYFRNEKVYSNANLLPLAERAFILFSQNKNLCGRCVGSIYGDVYDIEYEKNNDLDNI